MWAPQREALGAAYRVLCPDFRGFGGTPLPGGDAPSLDEAADDLAAALDARGVTDPVVLAGLSMGGYVAMAFLRRHPGRVAALVLADTKATADPPAAAANRERIAEEVVAAGSSAQLGEELLPKLLGSTTRETKPLVVGRVRAMVETAPPGAVAWAQRAMAARPDSTADLRAAGVPALVVVGAQDEITAVADAEAMVAALPDAQLVLLHDAGHLSSMEAPDAFNAAVLEFLARLPGG
jgi:pimeloyl-ACP methyl ester carboxylesterase